MIEAAPKDFVSLTKHEVGLDDHERRAGAGFGNLIDARSGPVVRKSGADHDALQP